MKDLTLKKSERPRFIKKVEVKGGTYVLTYADGNKFTGIEYNDENKKKIESVLKKQAELGIISRRSFKLRKTLCGVVSGFSAAMMIGGATFAEGLSRISTLDTTSCVIAGGSLIFFGSVSLFISQQKRTKNKEKLEQIDTLCFLQDPQTRTDILETASLPNGLTGVSSQGKKLFDKADPFGLIDVDSMHKEDYQTILGNQRVLTGLAGEGIKPTQYIKK